MRRERGCENNEWSTKIGKWRRETLTTECEISEQFKNTDSPINILSSTHTC